jgi:hypothetical protein
MLRMRGEDASGAEEVNDLAGGEGIVRVCS